MPPHIVFASDPDRYIHQYYNMVEYQNKNPYDKEIYAPINERVKCIFTVNKISDGKVSHDDRIQEEVPKILMLHTISKNSEYHKNSSVYQNNLISSISSIINKGKDSPI